MKRLLFSVLLISGLFLNDVLADGLTFSRVLKWDKAYQVNINGNDKYLLGFENAYYPESPVIPFYKESVFFQSANRQLVSVVLSNMVFDSTDVRHLISQDDLDLLSHEIKPKSDNISAGRKNGVHVGFIPMKKDPQTGEVVRLISFDMTVYYNDDGGETQMLKNDYADESVLAGGNWYKFAVSETGIYKITYNDLVDAGLDPGSINPQHIRIYGNGGGMLPEPNNVYRHDDLLENAIIVVGEDDGVFNTNDYIMFYGESPHEWKYYANSKVFEHNHNIYSDHNYYFLTADRGFGKRIATQPGTDKPQTDIVNIFNDYQVHEQNNVSIIKSGRQWYGEVFDAVLTRSFIFDFPNRVVDSVFNINVQYAARSLQSSSFLFDINGQVSQSSLPPVSDGPYSARAREGSITRNLTSGNEKIDVKITYNRNTLPSNGWLNYIRIHAMRKLIMAGDQMPFRNLHTVGPERVSTFRISNASSSLLVWDVSDPANVMQQQTNFQSNEISFRLMTDYLREFIVFNPSVLLSVEFEEKVPNQNLHAAATPEMLIVTHPLFLDEANRLAGFHQNFSNLDVLVATTTEIYNEFASGKQDVAAIRDFVKMLYDRNNNDKDFRYLLLFGDASYDYKDRVSNNTNFIPVWTTEQSLDLIYSYITDDFFGYLGENEGGSGINVVDLGIGRLPVSNLEQARYMVDKIIHYASNSTATMADWRNVIAFVADDEDNNLHIRQAEIMAKNIDSNYSAFNLSKVYLDSYQQVSVPGGERYPQANADINKRVQQGALIVNYTGHGGVLGWAHERVLELPDINSWTNYDMMPVFITATCEFAYFDDPSHTSAGELVILNPKGGGVALFTTTRPTYASPNFTINKLIYEYSFIREDGEYLRLGDIMCLAKQNAGNDTNHQKFVLLGDPALKLAIPEYNVVTTHLNGQEISLESDTLKALSKNTIEGFIADLSGNIMEDFEGVITPTVFDKAQKITTLANDGGETFPFSSQSGILYKGNSSISNGRFSFTFIVPKDIAYSYGNSKISYYATDGHRDANGDERSIMVGGYNEGAVSDNKGPLIEMYINDDNFKFGGITDQNPVLFARVEDESGINTTGNGIGHDITAVLNHETSNPILLNDYYQADMDTYQSGRIRYPFFNLPDGRYHLSLKVWDIYNNPAEASTEFVVATSGKIALEEVLNYPNPFRDQTYFMVSHNQAGSDIDVEIYIYSLDGRLRKVLQDNIRPGGYRSNVIDWDGRGDNGQLLESGTYVYRVVFRNTETGSAEIGNKLVIIR